MRHFARRVRGFGGGAIGKILGAAVAGAVGMVAADALPQTRAYGIPAGLAAGGVGAYLLGHKPLGEALAGAAVAVLAAPMIAGAVAPATGRSSATGSGEVWA